MRPDEGRGGHCDEHSHDHGTNRDRARCRTPPGARGSRPARRRRDGAVHRALPQGGHGHARRHCAACASGAAGLPARTRGAPGSDPRIRRPSRASSTTTSAPRSSARSRRRGSRTSTSPTSPSGGRRRRSPARPGSNRSQSTCWPTRGWTRSRPPSGTSRRTRGSPTSAAALDGARSILAERFGEDADLVGALREQMWSRGHLRSTVREGRSVDGAKFSDYFDASEPFTRLPSHRVLALLRGEKEGVLDLEFLSTAPSPPGAPPSAGPDPSRPDPCEERIATAFGIADRGRPADTWLLGAVRWAWRTRVLGPARAGPPGPPAAGRRGRGRPRLLRESARPAARGARRRTRDPRPRPGPAHRREGRGRRRHRPRRGHRDDLPARTAPPVGRSPSTYWRSSAPRTSSSLSPSATAPPRARPTSWLPI